MRRDTHVGQRQDWQTPEDVLQRVRLVFRDGFYDPCSTSANPTGAAGWADPEGEWGEPNASLRYPWFMNPPWAADGLVWWLDRFSLAPQGGIALVPALPDRAWWRTFAAYCPLVVTTIGRVKFVDPDTGTEGPQPPCGAAFGYIGLRPAAFIDAFAGMGVLAMHPDVGAARQNALQAENVFAAMRPGGT